MNASPVKQTKGLDAIIIETRQNVFLLWLAFKRVPSETFEASERKIEKFWKIYQNSSQIRIDSASSTFTDDLSLIWQIDWILP